MDRAEAVRVLREFRTEPEKRVLHAIHVVKEYMKREEVPLLETIAKEAQSPTLVAHAIQKLVLSKNTSEWTRSFIFGCLAHGDVRDEPFFGNEILFQCILQLADMAGDGCDEAFKALVEFAVNEHSPLSEQIYVWSILAGFAGVEWRGKYDDEMYWLPEGTRATEMRTIIREKLKEKGKWPIPD